jgi:hypothetical protein
MDVTKPYKFTGFGAMDVTKPYKFIGFGAMYVTTYAVLAVDKIRAVSAEFSLGAGGPGVLLQRQPCKRFRLAITSSVYPH